MRYYIYVLLLVTIVGMAIVGCQASPLPTATAVPQPSAPPQQPTPQAQEPFPDFGYLPDKYVGPVFTLSQNYPTQPPDVGKLPAFMKIDFQKDWKNYLLQARNYCFEGNIQNDWRVEKNTVRPWYHMPWQHYGQFGREGIHGLTKEAPVQLQQLAQTQTYTDAVAYAIGFYNEFGGYTIGQVWKDHNNPDPSVTSSPNRGFLNGSVLCKILFVSLPADQVAQQVPSLVNPIQWDAYITDGFVSCLDTSSSCQRSVEKVTLIQLDVMVRDDNAPLGWVFGNFQYNGALNNTNPWENLVPLGIQWGDDPDNPTDSSNPQPKMTIINPKLTQTIINPDANELPPTHLGWNGRLDGPVDDPQSSCMSCHSTAQYPVVAPILPRFVAKDPPKPGSPGWMLWFRNLLCAQPFGAFPPDSGPVPQSTDFSLQLSGSIQNFWTWRTKQDGLFAKNYAPNQQEGAGRKEYPVVRNLP